MSPSPPPPPTFDTLIPDPELAKLWRRLGPSRKCSQLHSRFWLVDIAASRRDWWASQQGGITVGRNEIDEECFGLDLNMHNVWRSRLWVRKDYVRIYEYCNKHLEETMEHPGMLHRKSYWISYAIRRRLGEGQPFMWCRSKFCFLFVEEGVFEMHQDQLRSDTFSSFIWTFTDASDTHEGVPFPMADTDGTFFNIHVSPPQRARWKSLMKSTSTSIVIMNPWTKDEIIQAARSHRVDPARMKHIEELFDQYGGIPRICVASLRRPDLLANHRRSYKGAIRSMEVRTDVQMLRDYTFRAIDLEFDKVPHTIFRVERSDLDDLGSLTIAPASPRARMDLKAQILKLRVADQSLLCGQFASMKESRQIAAIASESYDESFEESQLLENLEYSDL
ncbi:hypothetical protein BC826DRAFT_1175473 [Russula brevipes]|nr:hypothetical protein BC826DRAFT_1175473 [Russula brevipes]